MMMAMMALLVRLQPWVMVMTVIDTCPYRRLLHRLNGYVR
jgi:hypothetical protein